MCTSTTSPVAGQLQSHAKRLEDSNITTLLNSSAGQSHLMSSFDGLHLDAQRQLIDLECWRELLSLLRTHNVSQKIQQMFAGEVLNPTEKRAVLHVALRVPKKGGLGIPPKIVSDVHEVLDKIYRFADDIRQGNIVSHDGYPLTDVLCIGIGGSYLGVEFVYEACRTCTSALEASAGRKLHFLANVDPIDVKRALDGFDPKKTLVIVVSKTFTTAETMLNAQTVKDWILAAYQNDATCIGKHFCAVSTNLSATASFGIKEQNVFGFWDWVGGRYSVCSAVGVLPLTLHFGSDVVKSFLDGAHSMDAHFKQTSFEVNLPCMMGLVSFWNSTYLQHANVAILPYCQALCRFPAHIQQLTMESNGKGVCLDGQVSAENASGEIYFGEPGTNGQHSFYQLLHQGRVVPCEFIGFSKSCNPIYVKGYPVTNHDELMSNFFAQPDALAFGKSASELRAEGVPEDLIPHKTFRGNRPSMSLLCEGQVNPYRIGQLLALYEHRTVVQGWLWNINSFDQWGVELGKILAKDVRALLHTKRDKGATEAHLKKLPSVSRHLLQTYILHSD